MNKKRTTDNAVAPLHKTSVSHVRALYGHRRLPPFEHQGINRTEIGCIGFCSTHVIVKIAQELHVVVLQEPLTRDPHVFLVSVHEFAVGDDLDEVVVGG